MIKVTVEILPFGFEEGRRTIGEMTIANDGTGNHETGNYYGTVDGKKVLEKVLNHKRAEGVWPLIKKMLEYRKDD